MKTVLNQEISGGEGFLFYHFQNETNYSVCDGFSDAKICGSLIFYCSACCGGGSKAKKPKAQTGCPVRAQRPAPLPNRVFWAPTPTSVVLQTLRRTQCPNSLSVQTLSSTLTLCAVIADPTGYQLRPPHLAHFEVSRKCWATCTSDYGP